MSDAFDFSTLTNDTSLDFGEWDNWQEQEDFPPALPEGTYRGKVDKIRSADVREDGYLGTVVDLRVVGGAYDNRTVTWQRISNKPREEGNRASMLTDLLQSAGVRGTAPRSNQEYGAALNHICETATPVTFSVGWRGFCSVCYETKLVELTGASSASEAKMVASTDVKKEASKFATKAKSSRSFPNGQDVMSCPTCGNEVRAQVQIRKFLARR